MGGRHQHFENPITLDLRYKLNKFDLLGVFLNPPPLSLGSLTLCVAHTSINSNDQAEDSLPSLKKSKISFIII